MFGPIGFVLFLGKLISLGFYGTSSLVSFTTIFCLFVMDVHCGAQALPGVGCMGLVAPHHMGPCFPNQEWTRVPCIGRQVLSHWTTREVPHHQFLNSARAPRMEFSKSTSLTLFSSFPSLFPFGNLLTLSCLLNTPRYKAQFLACLFHPMSSSLSP